MADSIYKKLQDALAGIAGEHDLFNEPVAITCSVLSAEAAIGTPEHRDYPIITGKEKNDRGKLRQQPGPSFYR